MSIIRGDAFRLPLRDACVQCCITSPPYYQLRKYAGLAENHYGLENTIDEYLANTVQIFREVRRVLKPSACLFLNIGDAYQDKQLLMLPARVAMALQADGWYLRSAITIIKRNPMPESVTDRPTNATEMLFLLSKQADYYYDAEAVREKAEYGRREQPADTWNRTGTGLKTPSRVVGATRGANPETGRNFRNWIELTTEPNTWATCGDCHHTTDRWPKCAFCEGRPDKLKLINLDECPRCHGKQICPGCGSTNIIGHFAAFPSRIPELAIKAGTSEKGECVKCGAQVERVTESAGGTTGRSWHNHEQDLMRGNRKAGGENFATYRKQTIAWRATCQCNAGTRPNLVLDNFGGSGSTSVVAERLGRRHCMIELSADYIHIARARTRERSLFTAAGVSV